MPRKLEDMLNDPPEVRLHGLITYIESNMRFIESVTKNVTECTQAALSHLLELCPDLQSGLDAAERQSELCRKEIIRSPTNDDSGAP